MATRSRVPHGAVVQAAAFANQIVVLVQDAHGAVHLRGVAFDHQAIIVKIGGDAQGGFKQLQILIQGAEEILYLSSYLDGASHGECGCPRGRRRAVLPPGEKRQQRRRDYRLIQGIRRPGQGQADHRPRCSRLDAV